MIQTEESGLSRLDKAVLHTICYADVFDSPLKMEEIYRFLPIRTDLDQVSACLESRLTDLIESSRGLYFLRGRQALPQIRLEREAVSRRLWKMAAVWARKLTHVPFIHMVAVTGSLAVNNAEPEADIDFLIVTENGRLWLTRAIVMALWMVDRHNNPACFNFFLAEDALILKKRSYYTARELAQMVVLSGQKTHQRLMNRNEWIGDFLPNFRGLDVDPQNQEFSRPSLRLLCEKWLSSEVGAIIEKWEMQRRMARYGKQELGSESSFGPNLYKDHHHGHANMIRIALAHRLGEMNLLLQDIEVTAS